MPDPAPIEPTSTRWPPLGRIGEAEDVAAAALYLSSLAGQYVTGKMLEVDGGIQQPNLSLHLPDVSP